MAKNFVNIFKEIKNTNLQIAANRDCTLLPVWLLKLNLSNVTFIPSNISSNYTYIIYQLNVSNDYTSR